MSTGTSRVRNILESQKTFNIIMKGEKLILIGGDTVHTTCKMFGWRKKKLMKQLITGLMTIIL